MRFSSHDPAALRRKGRVLSWAGGLFTAALGVGAMLDGGWANLMFTLLFAAVGLGTWAFGWSALREAAALEREREARARRPEAGREASVEYRRQEAVRPAPEAEPRPTRRLIAVTVMFVGLILPAILGAFWTVREGGPGIFFSLFLLGLSSWLIFNVSALWKGELWAFVPAVAFFGFALAIALIPSVMATVSGELRVAAFAGAAASHFAIGLIALFSLRPWLKHLEWKSGRDPLATADKVALLAALKARKR